jgi:hypothetical protein
MNRRQPRATDLEILDHCSDEMTQSKSRRRCEKSATAFYKSGRDTQPGATVAASDEQSVTVPPSAAQGKRSAGVGGDMPEPLKWYDDNADL